jgi:hypothetical protein
MNKAKIHNDTFISAFINVNEWKDRRVKLIKGILSDTNDESEWGISL